MLRLVIAVYSFFFTGLCSLLAVMIIPDDVRVHVYRDNLIAGMAMNLVGPEIMRIIFRGFVVLVGFLILGGAVNTAIVGSTGVLMRIAEDGVLSDWFRKPQRKYGTSYRIVNLVAGMQLFVIVTTHGNVLMIGEAYAFGVIWSFTFNALAMLVLRWKFRGERGSKVPLNLRIGEYGDSYWPDMRISSSTFDCRSQSIHKVSGHGKRSHFRCRDFLLFLLYPSGIISGVMPWRPSR